MHGSDSDSETFDLCRRCAAGDDDAFREAYRKFGGKLYGTAWRILRNPEEAEEVVQEAFLALFRAREDPPRNLGGWLHRVTANRALDRVRSRTRRAEVELFEELHAEGAGSAQRPAEAAGTGRPHGHPASSGGAADAIALERAIDSLPERTRMVFILHDVEGFKHREVGALMGISDGSSKSQLFRARAMLREQLGKKST